MTSIVLFPELFDNVVGNTLTESETKVIIEDGITIGGKSVREHFEVIGHAKAYDQIYSLLEGPISEDQVLLLHRLFFEQIDAGNAAFVERFDLEKRVLLCGYPYQSGGLNILPQCKRRIRVI